MLLRYERLVPRPPVGVGNTEGLNEKSHESVDLAASSWLIYAMELVKGSVKFARLSTHQMQGRNGAVLY